MLKDERNWFRKHWILITITGIILLNIAIFVMINSKSVTGNAISPEQNSSNKNKTEEANYIPKVGDKIGNDLVTYVKNTSNGIEYGGIIIDGKEHNESDPKTKSDSWGVTSC